MLLRDYNVSFLAEREMILPGSDINGFMVNEVPRAQPIVWQMPSGDDMNTSIYKPLRRVAISLGVSGLCGCTSLWIISHKGVYASHWWESISFSPEKIWKLTKSETNAAVFRRTVINPLTTGETTSSGTPKQVKLTAADLDDSSIKAYLVHPEKDCKGKIDGYKTLWDDIKKEVGNIIPSLNPDTHKDRWEEPTYTRLDRDSRDLYETPAGHVLFKYDPNHKGKKKAMLWVENRAKPLYDDEW